MITKFGIVGVGVLAGLAAVAPLASASESHGDHHGHGGHGASSTCSVAGGEAGALNTINGDSLANVVAQAPIGGANVLNLTCNEILNDNLNGNSVVVSVLGTELPGLPF
ncbi:hypothetical protein [Actinomycetospora soli]|uniref:hypothetical protein n=1 Tax=Actinomycetospora soli TaxID=2893887 RepID=UPI001E346B30|nr:hypothetical protein [Actinomycetospora soli]MCD2186332.1 hypothetical protein [Actinomycetospora soli]